jgi:uncharacterized membrane protein YbaN (DUF454 family)
MSGLSGKLKRVLFIICGSIFLALGLVGVVLPILPTTPFLILAAACYIRGSERVYKWMITNRIFGEYIKNYLERRGITTRQKVYTLIFLWLMITISTFFISVFFIKILVFIIAIVVSIHILTLKHANE